MAGSGRSRRWMSASSTCEPAVSASRASSASEFSASAWRALGPDADQDDPLEAQLAVLDLGDVFEFGRQAGDPAQRRTLGPFQLAGVGQVEVGLDVDHAIIGAVIGGSPRVTLSSSRPWWHAPERLGHRVLRVQRWTGARLAAAPLEPGRRSSTTSPTSSAGPVSSSSPSALQRTRQVPPGTSTCQVDAVAPRPARQTATHGGADPGAAGAGLARHRARAPASPGGAARSRPTNSTFCPSGRGGSTAGGSDRSERCEFGLRRQRDDDVRVGHLHRDARPRPEPPRSTDGGRSSTLAAAHLDRDRAVRLQTRPGARRRASRPPSRRRPGRPTADSAGTAAPRCRTSRRSSRRRCGSP